MSNDIFPINHGRLFKLSKKKQDKILKRTVQRNVNVIITKDLRIEKGNDIFEMLFSTGELSVPCRFIETDNEETIPMIWFRILDHLRTWTNPLSFTKIQNAINANNDFPKIGRNELISILKSMRKRKLIKKVGDQWTDVRENMDVRVF